MGAEYQDILAGYMTTVKAIAENGKKGVKRVNGVLVATTVDTTKELAKNLMFRGAMWSAYNGKLVEANSKTTKTVKDNWAKTFAEFKKGADFASKVWTTASSVIMGASNQLFKNERANVENDYINKRNFIEANVTDEKEKQKQVQELEREKNKKIAEQQVALFNFNKATSSVQATINGFEAATKAFALLGPVFGPPAAAVIAGLAAVQVGAILAEEAPAIPTFAGGGSLRPNTTALVGEEGPELVRFNTSAQIANARDTRQMMSGRPIVINNTFGDVKSEVDIDRALMIGAQKLKNKLRGAV